MIHQLRKIGLSELEARCYLALYEEANLSGYEVAKRVSVSRTNVYSALRSLTDKGMCRAIESDPILYNAVPIEQLLRLLKSDFEKSAEILLEELRSPPQDAGFFYNLQGEKALKKTIKRLVSNANESIVVDIWAEDIHWVEDSLLAAEKRGVKVVLITIGECNSLLKNILTHKRSDEWNQVRSRKFSILCDASCAIVGSFGKQIKLSALETNHPSIIEILKNEFYHDVVMGQIEQDFTHELQEKYGDHYKNIIANYLEILKKT